MKKHILTTVACGLVTLMMLVPASRQVQAQQLKVGYTDHELIIANMPDYQDVQQQLQEEYQGLQEGLTSLQEEFQTKLQRYQKQQALLSEERRQEREQELMNLQQELQQSAAKSEQQLAEREIELLQPILERVDTAIKEVAKERGLDLVLRNQAGPMQPIILYVNRETIVDITPDVASKLGLEVTDEEMSSSTVPSSN